MFNAYQGNPGAMVGIHQREDIASVIAYVQRHILDLRAYVESRYPPESWDWHTYMLLQEPYLARTVIENHNTPDELKWEMWIGALSGRKPSIRIIYLIGKPGSGKTTFAYETAKHVKERTGREAVALGDPGSLPDFLEMADNLQTAPEGSIVVLDEAALSASARMSMTKDNKAIQGTLATIRHRNLILLVIAQNSKMADSTFLLLADAMVFKPLSLTQRGNERKQIMRTLRMLKELIPRTNAETLIHSDSLPPLAMRREEPDFMTDELSTAFRKLKGMDKILDHATKARRSGSSWQVVADRMAKRWEKRSWAWWKEKVCARNDGRDPLTGAKVRLRTGAVVEAEAGGPRDERA